MAISLNQPIKPDIIKLTKYLEQVNDSGWYTNFGPLHQELTERLEKYLGVENLLLVSNGTLALQVACKVLNANNALTTPFSFVATTSSLLWQGISATFCDIDRDNFNLCPVEAKRTLQSNPKIDTIVATHVYGNPCDVDAFGEIAKSENINVIYDAAHAFDVKVSGESILNFGDASTLSFHATKVFHTIEGGAIVFKNKKDFEKAKALINFGLNSQGVISEIGINAKMNEYQCAVGLTLLDDIDNIIEHRSMLFNAYRAGLKGVVDVPEWCETSSLNGAYMPIKLKSIEQRKLVEQGLIEGNIESRQYFSPALDTTFEENKVSSNRNSEALTQRILCLPLHFYMTIKDVKCVVESVKRAVQ